LAAFTSYLGVSGLDYSTRDGVLFQDSEVRFAEILDGTSNTLMLGERPPSTDLQFGWWYAGIGQLWTGSGDLILGVREQNLLPILPGSPCGPGAYPFSPGGFKDPCAMFHYWSPHHNGANFALWDGSVRLIRYSANPIIPALASRAGGEVASPLE
jgi:prepilin-type processing-associated H-X9-DG protein